MGESVKHVVVAGVAIFTLLSSAASSWAGPQEHLRNTRENLQRIRGLVDTGRQRQTSLKRRIDRLNRRITRAQIALNKVDSQIDDFREDVRVARGHVAATQQEIDSIHALATAQAVALYKSDGAEAIYALLSSTTLGELSARMEMLGAAAQQRTGALIHYGRLRARLRLQNDALFTTTRRLHRRRSAAAGLERRLARHKHRLAQDLSRLDVRLSAHKDKERHLEAAARRIRQKILAAQVGAELASLGISAEGFIWPLNGPVTSGFGLRWGGTHTGIDIDGYTGQPVAAAKGGTVIYAGSGMSGYGNLVVVDHGGGLSTLYAHLSGFAVGRGSVHQGQIVGYVGCTGSCYGDHLHFEFRLGGRPVDPLDYLP